MREMGIALATSISAWINAFLLYFLLKAKKNITLDNIFLMNLIKIIISVFVMLISCYILNKLFLSQLTNSTILLKIGALFFVIICSKIIYLTMIFMLKVLTISDLKGYINK